MARNKLSLKQKNRHSVKEKDSNSNSNGVICSKNSTNIPSTMMKANVQIHISFESNENNLDQILEEKENCDKDLTFVGAENLAFDPNNDLLNLKQYSGYPDPYFGYGKNGSSNSNRRGSVSCDNISQLNSYLDIEKKELNCSLIRRQSLLDLLTNCDRKLSIQEEYMIIENHRRNSLRDILQDVKQYCGGIDNLSKIKSDCFIRIFSKKEVLAKLFELFLAGSSPQSQLNNALNQDEWIESLKTRLNESDERQVDFVEVVESLAYAVCGDSDVDFEHFCEIFRGKNVLNKLYRLIDRNSDGIVKAEEVMDFISQLGNARSNSRLTKENINWLEKLFRSYVGDGNEIRKEDFKKIIQTKNQFFTDRVFDIFDRDDSGSISMQGFKSKKNYARNFDTLPINFKQFCILYSEFLESMQQFAGQNPDDKIQFLFKVYDVDGDSLIQEEELESVMKAAMLENGMNFSQVQIKELTTALFEDADIEKRGALTYDALKAQLEKHPGLLENLSISIERWLIPPKPKKTSIATKMQQLYPHQFSLKYIRNNYVYLIWLNVFLLTNIGLFISKYISVRNFYIGEYFEPPSPFLLLAKAFGECLNFNSAFIVVVMLRQVLTFLRARGASSYLPIDQHIYFHQMTGWLIFIFSLCHTLMHFLHGGVVVVPNSKLNSGNWSLLGILFDPRASSGLINISIKSVERQPNASLGLIPGYAFNSGILLVLIITIMVLCSLPFVRRGGCFEIFYYTHLLYAVFLGLIIFVHAPNFWKWFIGPGIIFIIEQAFRTYKWRVGTGRTYISSGILLPSKVIHLVIKRPCHFEFHPGDYVFVRIPTIAQAEWHPFTISSAPEQEDAIWLHIRSVGQWTTRLYEYFETEQGRLNFPNKDQAESSNFRARAGTESARQLSLKKVKISERFSTSPNPMADHSGMNQLQETAIDEPHHVKAARFKSIGDSQATLDPPSSSSSSAEDLQDQALSSVETVDEKDSSIKSARLHLKKSVVSTKSLPNVNERLKQRERKLLERSLPNVYRSHSIQGISEETDYISSNASGEGGNSRKMRNNVNFWSNPRLNSAAHSVRYYRNKPPVISLKTPSSDETAKMIDHEDCGYDENDGLTTTNTVLTNGPVDLNVAAEEGLALREIKSCVDDKNLTKKEGVEPTALKLGTTNIEDQVGHSLEIYVDGPYGAPSSHIFRAQHAVLIATGIGVTPFASILQSIMHRYWAGRIQCPNCQFTYCSELPQSVLNLRKVDFFWINRDQKSFEWFVHLLSQLEIEQAELGSAMERFLDMHMYITSALQKTDMKAVGLQLALDLLHEKEKRDLITGLKTRTNAGRPNWHKIFNQLAAQKKGKITVFYCGPPTLSRALKIKCDEFGFEFRKELF